MVSDNQLMSTVYFPGSIPFMAIVLTYDVNSRHTDIKNHLKTLGYTDTMRGTVDGGTDAVECDLPNTTLYHPTRTKNQGKSDIDTTAAHFGAVVEKTVAFELALPTSWLGQISRYV